MASDCRKCVDCIRTDLAQNCTDQGKTRCAAHPAPLTYSFTRTAGQNGTITGTATGNLEAGAQVSVTAVPNSGFRFVRWNATGVTLANVNAATASFAMPAGAVTLTAVFEANPCTHSKRKPADCRHCADCARTNLAKNCTDAKPCKAHEKPVDEFVLGLIVSTSKPGIADALEIFKMLANMTNAIEDAGKDSREWKAACILNKGEGTPGIADALEIFKFLANMPSELDEIHK